MHELNGSDARENAMKYFTEHGYEYQCYGDNNFWVHCTDPDDSGGDDLGVDCAFTFEEYDTDRFEKVFETDRPIENEQYTLYYIN